MPASKNRRLALVPSGTIVVISTSHGHYEEGVVDRGSIVWRKKRFESASAAARAMRGDDSSQVNGWKELRVHLASGGLMPLREAYDERRWDEMRAPTA